MYSYSFDRSEETLDPQTTHVPPRRIGAHLEIAAGVVRFADLDRAAARPPVWVEAFRVAVAHGCGVSDQVEQCIRQHAGSHVPDDFVATKADRLQLRKLLYPRPGLHARLLEMRRSGLLGLIFPEVGTPAGQDERHPPLVYAFDDRELAPIACLESLRGAKTGAAGRFRAMLDEVHSPELLTLALLLDRRGTRPDRDAAEVVHVVRLVVERLQLAAEARDAVQSLVARRREVAEIAFRRDTSDPAVVVALARLAGSDQLLKMLCLATLAHAEAGRPGRLSGWRRDLLWSLYVAARHRVLLGPCDDSHVDGPVRAVVLAGCPEDITTEELTGFLDTLPDRYLATFGVASVYAHVRLARHLALDGVHTSLERHDDVWQLTIVSRGTRHLFAMAAGVLSVLGMDIHRAQAMTTPEELVLDVFEFSDPAGLLGRTPGATSELDRLLEGVARGTIARADLDARAALPVLPAGSVTAQVRHEPGDRHTLVEITAADARGLLYRVCRTIAELGFDVDFALVSTDGGRANDVLHVTKHGKRLSERGRDALANRLMQLQPADDRSSA